MIIRCPNCDGEIDVKSEQEILICPYCKTNIYFDKKGLFLIEGIKPILDIGAAKEIIEKEIGENIELNLIRIPFYRFEYKQDTKFISGVKEPFPGLQFFTPQGDRYPLKGKNPPPEVDIKSAMEKLKIEDYDSAALLYVPFLSGKGNYYDVLIDGVTGALFKRETQVKERTRKRLKEPVSLVIFGISGIFALTIPGKLPKFMLSILFPLLWLIYKRVSKNG